MKKRNLGKCRDEHDEIWYWEKEGEELCPVCVLKAENARLREALKLIATHKSDRYASDTAKIALADKEAKP